MVEIVFCCRNAMFTFTIIFTATKPHIDKWPHAATHSKMMLYPNNWDR